MRRWGIALTVAVFVTLGNAMAASIPVTNAGFESPVMADGALATAVGVSGTYGWYEEDGTVWPPAYYQNPTTNAFTSIPEGQNVLLLDCRPSYVFSYVEQPGIIAINEAKVYTLQVYVGRNKTSPVPGEYFVALLKDGAVAADYITRTTFPAADSWMEITLTYTPMPGDGGKILGIRFGTLDDVLNAFLYFDDVRLSDADRAVFDIVEGVNWSFENPERADSTAVQLDDSGTYAWYDGNGVGTWPGVYINNPSAAQFPSGVAHGANAAELDVRDAPTKNSIVQNSILAIDETKVYTLTAKVGHSATQGFPQDSFVRLLKDGVPAADAASHIDPGADSWYEATVTYVPMPGDEGKMLGIQMGNQVGGAPNSYLWFDDLHLSCVDNPAPGEAYVLNWSFENPALPDGAYWQLDDSGIYAWDDGNGAANWPGVFIYDLPAGAFSSGAAHGSNAIQLDVRDPPTKNDIVQTDIMVIDETFIYTLTAKVGDSTTTAFPQDYFVRLLKDADTAAEVTSTTSPADGTWVEAKVLYTPAPGDGGKMLGIRMGNQVGGATGSYIWFDDVRLTAGPPRGTVILVE